MPKILHVRAEKLKDAEGVENPWALATWQLKREGKLKREGGKLRVARPIRRGD